MPATMSNSGSRPRLAVVVTHPIQYYAPWYRMLVERGGISVHAIFASTIGLRAKVDPGFGVPVTWNTDLLSGYSSEFLPGADAVKDTRWQNVNGNRLERSLTCARPDVILIHGIASLLVQRALWWGIRHKIPVMMISDSSLHSATTRWQAAVKRMVWPFLYRRVSAFLSPGDANRRYLEHYGVDPARIFPVPNLVDPVFWAARERVPKVRDLARRALGIADDEFAVLFVGKFIERKRPGDIIAALRLLYRKIKVRAIFAGTGPLLASLRQQAEADALPANFLGFVNIGELPSCYSAADALIHPADVETFGMIALEAAVTGLPLVLSKAVGAIGPNSIAREGENALLFAPGDVHGLVAAIEALACDPARSTAMRQASLRVSSELDWRASLAGTTAALEFCGRKSSQKRSLEMNAPGAIPGGLD